MNDLAGFTLIEMVCVLALVGLLAAIALPAFPTSTTRIALSGYAVEIASMLKRDRVAAVRTHELVATRFDSRARSIVSGADGARVTLPGDVVFDALLAQRCGDRRTGSTIDFLPSGESCGGTVAISRHEYGFQIRVNWLTGGVEVVPSGNF